MLRFRFRNKETFTSYNYSNVSYFNQFVFNFGEFEWTTNWITQVSAGLKDIGMIIVLKNTAFYTRSLIRNRHKRLFSIVCIFLLKVFNFVRPPYQPWSFVLLQAKWYCEHICGVVDWNTVLKKIKNKFTTRRGEKNLKNYDLMNCPILMNKYKMSTKSAL